MDELRKEIDAILLKGIEDASLEFSAEHKATILALTIGRARGALAKSTAPTTATGGGDAD